MTTLRIKAVGLSLSALFAITYVLCVIWDLVLPGWAMYQVWQRLFPGFSWSAAGLLIGLFETVVYGFYAAAVFVPVYNYVHRREMAAEPAGAEQPAPMAHH